ncbi:MAG: amino acid ABC transporter permease [Candidatus Methanodesulfokora sp.]|jgi:polar amino acid transport system permease protein
MDFWTEFLGSLLSGLLTTLQMILIAAPAGILMGLLLGTMRVYGGRVLSSLALSITAVFRGFPLLVTLFILFFGLPEIKIYLPPFWAAVIGFVLCSGAYISEYVRGSILSIEEGQSLAARSIGMTKLQEILYIILPQAIRRALPSISNEIAYMIQYSSLAFAIGVQEIFSISKTFNSIYFKSIEIFSVLAIIYIILGEISTYIFRFVEKRIRIPS